MFAQRKKELEEFALGQERLRQEQEKLSAEQEKQREELREQLEKLYHRIAITESNLNYYGMIHNIQEEFYYANLELLMNPAAEGNNILVAGFYGAYNLGDELMLQTLLHYLLEKDYGNVTVLLCDNIDYDYFDFPNVRFIHYPKNRFDFNIIAQQYDTLIWGGGALIDDSRYGDRTDISYLGTMLLEMSKRFLAFGKKCLMLGLSSNQTLTNEKYIRDLKKIIDKSAYFSVRDLYTKSVLEHLGADREKIHFLNDLVLASDEWEREAGQKKRISRSEKKIIGIVFICLEETRQMLEQVIDSVYNSCMALYGEDFEIRCIPFYDYHHNDIRFYQSVVEKYEKDAKHIVVRKYAETFSEILEELKPLEFMINMRYHATLLSMVLEIPSLNICMDDNAHYYNKIKYITETGNYEDSVLMFGEWKERNMEEVVKKALTEKKKPSIERSILLETQNSVRKILEGTLVEE